MFNFWPFFIAALFAATSDAVPHDIIVNDQRESNTAQLDNDLQDRIVIDIANLDENQADETDDDTLPQGSDALLQDGDALLQDSDALQQDSDALQQHSDALLQDSDALLQDSDALQQDSDALLQDSVVTNLQDSQADQTKVDALLQDSVVTDVVNLEDNQADQTEDDALPQDSDALLQDSDALLQDSDALQQDSDALLQDSDALLQGSDALQQDSDALLQNSVVTNLRDSQTGQTKNDELQQNSDSLLRENDDTELANKAAVQKSDNAFLQDSVVIDVPDDKTAQDNQQATRAHAFKVERRNIRQESPGRLKKDTRRKPVGIAFPSTDLQNPRKFVLTMRRMVLEFKKFRASEIPALKDLKVSKIKIGSPITKAEAASEILCILEQLYDIIPGTKQFVKKMVRLHGPKYGIKSFADFATISVSEKDIFQRNECKVIQAGPAALSMLRTPVQLQVKNFAIYLVLAELEYQRDIKRNIG